MHNDKVGRYNNNGNKNSIKYVNTDQRKTGFDETPRAGDGGRAGRGGYYGKSHPLTFPANNRTKKQNKNINNINVNKAAVAIKCKEGVSYAEVLRRARNEISLSRDLDINDHHVRQAYTGGYLIEVCGENCEDKALQT